MKISCLFFLLMASLSGVYSQSIDSKLSKIRAVYTEVNDLVSKDDEIAFSIEDKEQTGVITYDFYDAGAGDRLYLVIKKGGHKEGEEYEVEYYFNASNEPVFVFEMYFMKSWYGMENVYRETRVYIYDDQVIHILKKEIKDKDLEKVQTFRKDISNIPNMTIESSQSDLYEQALHLQKIWKLNKKL